MMIEAHHQILSSLRFNSAPTPDDVWKPSLFHVGELHRPTVERVFEGVDSARGADDSSPLGVVIQGPSGSGKTHMLGMVRERVQQEGGYFFLVSLLNGKAFWESTALAMVEGLLRESTWGSQLTAFLRRLTAEIGVEQEVRDAVAGAAELTPKHLQTFIGALRAHNRAVGQETEQTARALVLHGSRDTEAQDVGYAYLNSLELTPEARALWRMGPGTRSPQLLVRDMSRLFALTKVPTVIAIDQIDTLFAQQSDNVLGAAESTATDGQLLGQIADGLMMLRESTRRTLIVLSCIPDTWQLLKARAATPVPDRFRETSVLKELPTPEIGRAIVEKRLQAHYDYHRFTAPYPTWPIRPTAFTDAPDYTPRALLKRVERHILTCLREDTVTELDRLGDLPDGPGGPLGPLGPLGSVGSVGSVVRPPKPAADHAPSDLDKLFAELVGAADISGALEKNTEDKVMPALLAAGLRAWTEEMDDAGQAYKFDPPPAAKPALHARLRRTLDERTENELHWAFRAISSTSAVSVISSVRAACTMAGLDPRVPQRKLILLRNRGWDLGPKTREVVAAFREAGGMTLPISVEDLAVFAALKEMMARRDPDLRAWLIARRPAGGTDLFRAVLSDELSSATDEIRPPTDEIRPPAEPIRAADPVGAVDPVTAAGNGSPRNTSVHRGPSLTLGVSVADGQPLSLALESLRKHTAIFAGSGSGKTVLIRRLVEECALQGVSAIVLDPNNDLARLGDHWPTDPAGWWPGDRERAEEYLANTDVVVWTPRRAAGRPLTFQPLPDFSSVRDDPDEFAAAVDAAVAALAPRAKVDTATAKSQQGQAILRAALRYQAKVGATGLKSFIGTLAALPDGAIDLTKAEKIAAEMADTLTAAMENDPLFGGDGTPIDPGVLLTPPPGKRARVSVISFVGLPGDAQRQGFVNLLQMALFAWIKKNPAGDRPLGGLFVMDEAQTLAPSGAMTACTQSTLALASQARKYGLGLVFATQAPKGLHNQIPGNAATQFFGLLNAPAQIDAAKEMAQAKGGSVTDIGLLTTGQFYAAREGYPFRKVQTPLCLTYHPRSPLSPEEVIRRAATA